MNEYNGHYSYSKSIIEDWDSNAIGVYYCGYVNSNNQLIPLYIGRAVSDSGIRGRLLDHIREDYWPGVTHFGYHLGNSVQAIKQWEKEEIERYKPKYNTLNI